MADNKPDWKATFLQVYRRLVTHYGAAFLRTSMSENRNEHAAHWQRFLHTERVRAEEMVAAADAAMASARFRTYPPNPAEFVALVHQARAVEQFGIPTPDVAYQQACGLITPTHPLVKHVRAQIGGWFMRTRADNQIRQRFMDSYQEATEALSRGTLTLESIQAAESTVVQAVQTLSGDELASRLDRIMAKAAGAKTDSAEPIGP